MTSLATDLLRALDPVALGAEIGLEEPDPWQQQVLRSGAARVLMNCCRQSGKSTVAAVAATHTALYEPGSLALVLSPGLRQSTETFRKVVGCYRGAGRPVPAEVENKLSLELANGSRIVSLPGTEATVRSFSAVRLLVIDEAARVADDLYRTVRPMLAVSGGRIVALSTPFGQRGWWHAAWTSTEPWLRVQVPATDCPRISPEFLAEEERTLGEWWFRQEYECAFMDAETAAFASRHVEQMFSEEVQAWQL